MDKKDSEITEKLEQISDLDAMERRKKDRRTEDKGSPVGVERRQWQDRRKIRSKEGRVRYLDMVQRVQVGMAAHQ